MGPAGLGFPIGSMSQYTSSMPQPSDCHQMSGYDLMAQSHHHHHHSFPGSFQSQAPIHHHPSAASQNLHPMSAFPDYSKQSEEYSKAMHSMTDAHFAKSAGGASIPSNATASMLDCYAKLNPETNNNWNHNYAGNSSAAYPPSAVTSGASSAANAQNTLCHIPTPADYGHSGGYGINIGQNF